MKKYILLFVSILSFAAFVGCSDDDGYTPPNYVTFERGPLNVGVDVGSSTSYDVTVYTANITGQDRTFDVSADASSTLSSAAYTLPATVTIPANSNEGTISVDVSDVDLGLTGKRLVLNVSGDEEVLTGSGLILNVARTCVGKEFVVNFVFDGYASETSWGIFDAAGTLLVQGGGYADGAETATRSLCLPQGTYTFVVQDSYGDGLTYPNLGSVTLSYAGATLVTIPGNYDAGTSVEFTF